MAFSSSFVYGFKTQPDRNPVQSFLLMDDIVIPWALEAALSHSLTYSILITLIKLDLTFLVLFCVHTLKLQNSPKLLHKHARFFVMQMRKVNRKNSYCKADVWWPVIWSLFLLLEMRDRGSK